MTFTETLQKEARDKHVKFLKTDTSCIKDRLVVEITPRGLDTFISETIQKTLEASDLIVREEMDKLELETNAEFIACDDLAIKIIKRLSTLTDTQL